MATAAGARSTRRRWRLRNTARSTPASARAIEWAVSARTRRCWQAFDSGLTLVS